MKKILIGFTDEQVKIISDYAEKYCAGNFSAAVRKLVFKGVGDE